MNMLWPAIRALYRNELLDRCSKCILSSRYASIHSVHWTCAECQTYNHESNDAQHEDYVKSADMYKHIEDIAMGVGKRGYHAVLLFSGGKDSCYMLMKLMKGFPNMRILCVSVDNTFMAPAAIDNINSTIKKLGVEHIWVRPPEKMMHQIFRSALLDNVGKPGLVDLVDGELICDIARNVAKSLNIPLVFMGLSSEQVQYILDLNSPFERITERSNKPRETVSGIPLDKLCDEKWHSWWWNGAKSTSSVPQFVFPYYAWKTGNDEIMNTVVRSGVISAKKLSPIDTNHKLIVPMAVTDYIRRGYFVYEPEIAKTIRLGRAKRSDWIDVFQYIELAAKTGKFLGREFDHTLNRLGITRKDLGIPG